jgi:hypothetical protein
MIKGREGKERRGRERRQGKEGKEGRGGEGCDGVNPPVNKSWLRPWVYSCGKTFKKR